MKHGGTYQVFDRCYFLMQSSKVIMKNYLEKFEVSRSGFFRDINHLKYFYDIEFQYDRITNTYIRKLKNE